MGNKKDKTWEDDDDDAGKRIQDAKAKQEGAKAYSAVVDTVSDPNIKETLNEMNDTSQLIEGMEKLNKSLNVLANNMGIRGEEKTLPQKAKELLGVKMDDEIKKLKGGGETKDVMNMIEKMIDDKLTEMKKIIGEKTNGEEKKLHDLFPNIDFTKLTPGEVGMLLESIPKKDNERARIADTFGFDLEVMIKEIIKGKMAINLSNSLLGSNPDAGTNNLKEYISLVNETRKEKETKETQETERLKALTENFKDIFSRLENKIKEIENNKREEVEKIKDESRKTVDEMSQKIIQMKEDAIQKEIEIINKRTEELRENNNELRENLSQTMKMLENNDSNSSLEDVINRFVSESERNKILKEKIKSVFGEGAVTKKGGWDTMGEVLSGVLKDMLLKNTVPPKTQPHNTPTFQEQTIEDIQRAAGTNENIKEVEKQQNNVQTPDITPQEKIKQDDFSNIEFKQYSRKKK